MGARQGAESEDANIGAAKDCADESAAYGRHAPFFRHAHPVWFPPTVSDDQVRDTLLDTLHDCEHFLPWEHVVLVVDGDARSYAVVQNLQAACRQRYGQAFEVLYSAENGGKGAAVIRGTQWFWHRMVWSI